MIRLQEWSEGLSMIHLQEWFEGLPSLPSKEEGWVVVPPEERDLFLFLLCTLEIVEERTM